MVDKAVQIFSSDQSTSPGFLRGSLSYTSIYFEWLSVGEHFHNTPQSVHDVHGVRSESFGGKPTIYSFVQS